MTPPPEVISYIETLVSEAHSRIVCMASDPELNTDERQDLTDELSDVQAVQKWLVQVQSD